jgi:hypothetical protein
VDDDIPDAEHETQWTDQARTRYQAATRAVLEALSAHTDLVAGRVGRQAELGPYFTSTERLQEVLEAFRDAEFDLCGSVPYAPLSWDEDEADEDEDGQRGPLVSVVHQVEFEVLDEDRLVEAGRAAYRQAWPKDTAEDALVAVTDVPSAVGELVHVHGWDVLEAGTEYLRPRTGETSIVQFGDGTAPS